MSHTVEQFADELQSQDEPPPEAIEREERANKDKPAFLELSAAELNKVATTEWREQSALRGPIIIPEWNNAGVFCKRLSYLEQQELIEVYRAEGIIGAFCFRALNSNGERIYANLKMFGEDMKNNWNAVVIERVVGEMSSLCRTQLTDKELGNS